MGAEVGAEVGAVVGAVVGDTVVTAADGAGEDCVGLSVGAALFSIRAIVGDTVVTAADGAGEYVVGLSVGAAVASSVSSMVDAAVGASESPLYGVPVGVSVPEGTFDAKPLGCSLSYFVVDIVVEISSVG